MNKDGTFTIVRCAACSASMKPADTVCWVCGEPVKPSTPAGHNTPVAPRVAIVAPAAPPKRDRVSAVPGAGITAVLGVLVLGVALIRGPFGLTPESASASLASPATAVVRLPPTATVVVMATPTAVVQATATVAKVAKVATASAQPTAIPATPAPTTTAATATPAIEPTQVLTVFVRAPAATDASASTTYLVQPGDTCGEIAKRLNIPLSQLASLNGLDSERCPIKRDQVLRVPKAAAGPQATPVPVRSYTVTRGDTCLGIARRMGVTLNSLLLANQLGATCFIKPGQLLRVP
jgi:LysM repeat protein